MRDCIHGNLARSCNVCKLAAELTAAKAEIEHHRGNLKALIIRCNELKSENKRLREALERFADKNNWGYFDPSGCPKGVGESVESWVHNSDPVVIAQSALDGKGGEA